MKKILFANLLVLTLFNFKAQQQISCYPGNTIFENIDSRFKSDLVGEYYDDKTEDLTFWWENDNKHWK
jgi:hypothetical protein